MSSASLLTALVNDVARLESGLSDLCVRLQRLEEENRSLRQRVSALTNERAALIERNDEARQRVEAMIGRLKDLEHGS